MSLPLYADEVLVALANRVMFFMPVDPGPGLNTTLREAMIHAAKHSMALRTFPPDMPGEYPLDQARRLAAHFQNPTS